MASERYFRIKQGLLWDIKKRIPLKIIESPAFMLLNSVWKVMIDVGSVHEKKPSDIMVNIFLRNLSDSQLSQSFKVTTFLHDKKTDTHMKCSTVIVSSTYVTMYTISYDALRMKLSYSDMSSGLIVLFLFSAPVELGLEMKKDCSRTEQGINVEEDNDIPESRLRVVPCLIWESEMPRLRQRQISPVFYLLYTVWKLEIALAKSHTFFNSAYEISLKWLGSLPPLDEVEVLTFLDPKEYDVSYRLSSRPDGTYASINTLCKARFESIPVDASRFKHCNDITVISIFNPFIGLSLIREIKRDKYVFLECSLCQNHGCFIQENMYQVLRKEYSPAPFLHNILSLPEDFSTHDDAPSDVQLKYGEAFIFAHKVALASRSALFKAILSPDAGNINKNQTIIVHPFINEFPVLLLFLDYLYTGKLPVSLAEDLILRFYKASSACKAEILQQMCRCFFAKNLREDNYITLMIYALATDDIELKKAISLFVIVNPTIMQSESYRIFSVIFSGTASEIYRMYQELLARKII